MKMTKYTLAKMRPSTLADRLGEVKAQIADLQEKEEKLKDELVDRKLRRAEGKLFRCTVSRFVRSYVDVAGVLEELDADPEVVKLHTRRQRETRVLVTSR